MIRYPPYLLFLAILISTLVFSGNVHAQATNWTTSGTGDWNNAANWNNGVPTASGTATIASGGTAILSSATGMYNILTVGNVTTGALTVSGGVLTGTTLTTGSLGTGAVTVSGGTYNTTTVTINSTAAFTGAMTLSGGVLSTTSVTAAPVVGATTLTFNGGTLQASASNATFISGFPNGSITLGASGGTIDTNGFSITTANQISGSGFLTTTGTGILTLTGSNTYTGNTTIGTSGTLQLGNGGTTGSIASNLGAVNGSLVFNRSDAGLVIPTSFIFGSGTVIQAGTGLTTLTGTNAYTGLTTISSGTLQLGNGGTTGAITLSNIADSSALVFNRSNSSTFSGTISGTGRVIQAGTGVTILTGANTYSGTTTISSGTLQLGSGGALGTISNSDVTDNGVLVFDHSNSIVYAGKISGTGSLTQGGTGRVILNDTNTYTGGTTISSGTLQIGNGGTGGSLVGNVTNNGVLAFNHSNANTFSGAVSGTGSVLQSGVGATTFTGSNSYTGGTTISAGSLQLGAGGTTGSIVGNVVNNTILFFDRSDAITFTGTISGTGQVNQTGSGLTTFTGNNTYTGNTVIFSGTVQLGNGGTTGSIVGSVGDGTALVFNRSDAVTFSGSIFGAGAVTQAGSGITILTGSNTYAAGTTISSGTLQLGNGGTTGSILNNVVDNGALVFNRSDAVTFSGTVSGAGSVTQAGTGQTILTGNNTYTGVTTISTGTLQLGSGGTTGSIGTGNVVDNSVLVFNRSDAVTFSSTISGTGAVIQAGTGVTILTGNNTYTGNTTISSGTLQLGNGGATGVIVGNVTDNGALVFNRSNAITFSGTVSGTGSLTQAGTGQTTLTGNNTYTGATTISSGTLQLGNGGTTGSVVTTSIVDNGALVFNRSDAVTFSGTVSGTGSLTQAGSGVAILTGNNTYTGATTISSGTLQLGNGGTTGSVVTTSIVDNGALVFNRSDAVTFSGTVSGAGSLTQAGTGLLTLTGTNTYTGGTTISTGTLQLGNGGTTGSIGTGNVVDNSVLVFNRSDAVTFSSTISGTGAVIQAGTGVTILTGNNTYTGNTTISSGTLQLGNGGATGVIVGNVTDNGALVFNRSNAITFSGTVSGTGSLTQAGTGQTTLTGNNTYTGATTISSGTLQLGNGGTTGSVVTTSIVDNGALVFNRSDAVTFSGTVSGTGSLTQAGSGVAILTGNNTYTGATTISSGTLQLGNGGTTGSVVTTSIVDNGALVFNRSDAVTFSGTVSGAGSLTQAGTGLLTLTGTNTYTGGTTISTGTLQLGNGGTTGSIVNNVVDNGNLVFNRSDAVTFPGTISGTGAVTQAGTGVTILIANNTYTGTTTISSGTLQIGNGGTSGAIVGPIVDNADLVFNRSDIVTAPGDITGTGNVTQAGSGNLIFTGSNMYTGTTTISSGTLSLGNGGTTGSVIGPIVDNSVLVFNRSDANNVVPNTISGVGSVIQLGTGLTSLTGTNTYTGGTTITSGTLSLGNGGTTGSIVGNVTDNGTLSFNRTDVVTFSGTVSGAGNLAHVGSGATILTGNNTYTGNTTISSGTLQLGDGGATGSIIGNVVDNGALVFDRSDAVTFSGTISGIGNMIQAGSGTTILTGNNTYSGITAISAGALQVGNGGTTGSLGSGPVVDNANLIFNLISSTTVSGNISGSGALTQAGSGATTLTGNNNYTGGTLISLGTLIGSTSSLQGSITNNSNLVFAQASIGIFSGGIMGPGIVTVNSPGGKVSFNTNQTYIGTTIIQAGELSVNASLSSTNVLINTSGTLGGVGTIAGNVTNSGVIRPGTNPTSPGLLSISGNYVQNSNGTMVIAIASATSYDQLAIGGTANLDGTLEVELLGGFVPNTSSVFTILTAAGGVSGTFSNMDFPEGFPLQIFYDPNDVRLAFTGTPTPLIPPSPSGPSPSVVGTSGKGGIKVEEIVQEAVVAAEEVGEIEFLLALLGISFEELIPAMAGNVKDILFNVINNQYGQLTTRMAAIRSGVNEIALQGLSQEPMAQAFSKHQTYAKRVIAYGAEVDHWDIFASASGVFSKLNNVGDLPSARSIAGLFCVGADNNLNQNVSIGVYTGYQGLKSWYANGSWLRSNGVKFGLYATAQWEGFYLNGIVGGGANSLNFSRNINLRDTQLRARSHPFVGELDSLLGGGYEYRLGSWILGANNSIQYTYLGGPSFTESGAENLNVRVDKRNASSLVYTLGGNISYLWELAPNCKVLPTAGLSWQHEFLNYGQRIDAAFANGTGTPFFFNSPTAARSNAFGIIGITTQIGSHLGAWVYWTTQWGGGQIYANGFQVGLGYSF